MKHPFKQHAVKLGAMAFTLGTTLVAGIGTAQADTGETKGGFKIKTDDGRFEFSLGGRIMYDAFIEDNDTDAKTDGGPAPGTAFGSGTPNQQSRSSTYFRRLYLTMKGKAYGWNFKFEPDFSGNSTNNTGSNCTVPGQNVTGNGNTTGTIGTTPGATVNCDTGNASRDIAFQDVYISHAFGPGGEIFIGQMKPFRGMEELTSSNDLTMMERPFASASAGMFNGGSSREFQQGLFYKMDLSDFLLGASFFDLRRDNSRPTEGLGYNGRIVYAPVRSEGLNLHFGVSYSDEDPQKNGDTNAIDNVGSQFNYAGRRGPNVSFLTTGGEHAKTVGGELAGNFGPATLQAEYMHQQLGQATALDTTGTTAGDTQSVDAWYVMGSFFVTGESKPYKKADGAFGQPKPKNDFGAIELAVRYDYAENKDVKTCAVAGATKCEVSDVTIGANYYVNPNVKFMLNYIMGELDTGIGKDKPNAVTARAQFAF